MRCEADAATQPWVLQLCHGYDGPFLDCARQYAALFVGSEYKVCTVYLTGEPRDDVVAGSASDEVLFLDYKSEDIRGLKLNAIRRIRDLVRGRDFRFCIAHRFKPIYISLLATSLPVIGVHHAFGVYKRQIRRWFIRRFRSRLLLLGVSNAVREDIRHCLPGWDRTGIATLYNRIDVAAVQAVQVSRQQARDHLGLPYDAWVVGNVGRLHPDKDQATLIRGFAAALPELPPGSVLAIMGKGRLERELKDLAVRLGVAEQVLFLGQVKDGKRYFKAFDVFALSSDHEPFGMVLLEAMAAGVPLISTDCGGAKEIVTGLGPLFPWGDVQALAAALAELSSMTDADVLLARQRMVQRLNEYYIDDAVRPLFFQRLQESGRVS
ncbi:glycosyltransferase [Halopseudomonas bauzanensis]|uniref:glycosyltransferase n=1 Tax=Halopseudomonas bauzanensis TaxID=653930 RepID=UPI0025543971|nr:glycosyltransferase [Halopseudomonas bauzanensis]